MEKLLHKNSVSTFLKIWYKVKILEDEGYHVEIITHGSKTYIKAYKDYCLIDVNNLPKPEISHIAKFKSTFYDICTSPDTKFNIRKIRKFLNIRPMDAANAIGISRQSLYNWEVGNNRPKEEYMKKLKDFFLEEANKQGISIEHLLNEEE